jgi:hypothetical protein
MIAIVSTAPVAASGASAVWRRSKRPRINATPAITTGTIRNRWIRGESPDCAISTEMMPAEKTRNSKTRAPGNAYVCGEKSLSVGSIIGKTIKSTGGSLGRSRIPGHGREFGIASCSFADAAAKPEAIFCLFLRLQALSASSA